MGRLRIAAAWAFGVAVVARLWPKMNEHGLWFDEAYSARLAILPLPRLIEGAAFEIHPPGWTLLCSAFLRLPLEAEVALRLPSLLAVAGLVVLVGRRNLLAAVAVVGYAPLLDQATQGRPYAVLTLGLVCGAQLCRARAWILAGLTFGVTSSLHVLAGPLCASVFIAFALSSKSGPQDLVKALAPWLLLCIGWLPDVVTAARSYLGTPWYGGVAWADVSFATSRGAVGIASAGAVWAAARGKNWEAILPAAACGISLFALELAGIGTEIRKSGIVILPLLLAGLAGTRTGLVAAGASALALFMLRTPMPVRPDLREARDAIAELATEAPVLAVFASEASWYLRLPAPLAGGREADEIVRRIDRALQINGSTCLINIALPATFPGEADLPTGVRTIAAANVTGLDVRLLGSRECTLNPTGERWLSRP